MKKMTKYTLTHEGGDVILVCLLPKAQEEGGKGDSDTKLKDTEVLTDAIATHWGQHHMPEGYPYDIRRIIYGDIHKFVCSDLKAELIRVEGTKYLMQKQENKEDD